jgi:hypothetical protein
MAQTKFGGIKFKSDFENDLTVNSNKRMRTFTISKKHEYSAFDHDSDKVSNATEIRPSLLSSAVKVDQNTKPTKIKGFCMSLRSSKSEIEEPMAQGELLDLKQHFYNSGNEFYQLEENGFVSPVKPKKYCRKGRSQKDLTEKYRIEVDSSVEEINAYDSI